MPRISGNKEAKTAPRLTTFLTRAAGLGIECDTAREFMKWYDNAGESQLTSNEITHTVIARGV